MEFAGAGEVDVKITGQPGTASERIAPRREVVPDRAREARAPERTETDRIELSSVAKNLARLAREVGDVRDVDPARVDELRSRIASGEYDPANEDVAAALLRDVAADERGR